MRSSTRDAVGQKTRRVDVILPAETTGDSQVSDTTVASGIWASFDERGGADRTGMVAESAAVFTVWYRTDITPRHVIVMGTRRFQVESAGDRVGDKVEIEIVCTEKQPGGDNA